MIFYLCNSNELKPTQAEARALDRNFVQIDVPVDKAGLMAFVNDLYARVQIDDAAYINDFTRAENLPVAVTLDTNIPGSLDRIEVIARFATVSEAEDFLATSAAVDPDRLAAGNYGIDAPEELVNPPRPVSYTEQSINWDESFTKLPLAHQFHFAAMAMENARERLA